MNRNECAVRTLEASERPISRQQARRYADQLSWNDIMECLNGFARLDDLKRLETKTDELLRKKRESSSELVFPATPNQVGKYYNKSGKTIIRWMDKLKIRPPMPGGRISITKEIFEKINEYYLKGSKY